MTADRPWLVEREADTVHIRPVDDLTEHAFSDECCCGPTLDPVERPDGSFGWMYVHHSLDGREQAERASDG